MAMAGEGARVVVASRKADGVAAAVDQIEAAHPGKAVGKVLHVGKLPTLSAFFDAVVAEVGTPDILVNNAGTNPYFGPLLGAEWPAWDKTFDVNLKGPFEMTRQFAQRAFAAGRGGSVINVSSILGQVSSPMQGIYGMTKAALISMTKTMALELGQAGIRVNAIAPGVVDTKLAAAITSSPQLLERVKAHTALQRVAQPSEVAGIIVFLASDEASYVTGHTYNVDGGYTVV